MYTGSLPGYIPAHHQASMWNTATGSPLVRFPTMFCPQAAPGRGLLPTQCAGAPPHPYMPALFSVRQMVPFFYTPIDKSNPVSCLQAQISLAVQQQQHLCRLATMDPSLGNNMQQQANGVGGEKRKRKDSGDGRAFKKAKVITKALKAQRPGFSEERFNETSYYYDNGLRKVYPYYFTFTTFCKGRWVGQRIIDVFSKEFRAYGKEEYERCISSGTLTVNFKPVDCEYRLQQNDLLANVVHRHEVPVANQTIKIIHISDDLVVVDKPASIPVHPCGRYRHNTMAFLLAKEHCLRDLRTIHRLDRLTSGLLMFGRTAEQARKLENQIRSRQVIKEYVCRVEGEFPDDPIICEEPIEVVSYKIGVCRVSEKGKECRTEFQKLSYNGNTSIVLCRPKTGRMHQIRVHLQYLGYPIVNDPLYNHWVFGPEKGKNGNIGKSNEELIQQLIKIHTAENWIGLDGEGEADLNPAAVPPAASVDGEADVKPETAEPTTEPGTKAPEADTKPVAAAAEPSTSSSLNAGASTTTTSSSTESCDLLSDNTDSESVRSSDSAGCSSSSTPTVPDPCLDAKKLTFDGHCYECKVKFKDPQPKDLVMYLHALSYKGPDWEYKTDMPKWAEADWNEADGP